MLPAGVRGIAPLVRLPSACDRHVHAHLGAPMRPRYDLHRTAPSSDPPDDRLADAEPSLGNRVHVEPIAMIAHEDLNLVGSGLAIHGDGLAAMRHGVDERLLRGIEQRVGLGTGLASPTVTTSIGLPCSSSVCAAMAFSPALTERSDVVRS